jgi:hypothetical protein
MESWYKKRVYEALDLEISVPDELTENLPTKESTKYYAMQRIKLGLGTYTQLADISSYYFVPASKPCVRFSPTSAADGGYVRREDAQKLAYALFENALAPLRLPNRRSPTRL